MSVDISRQISEIIHAREDGIQWDEQFGRAAALWGWSRPRGDFRDYVWSNVESFVLVPRKPHGLRVAEFEIGQAPGGMWTFAVNFNSFLCGQASPLHLFNRVQYETRDEVILAAVKYMRQACRHSFWDEGNQQDRATWRVIEAKIRRIESCIIRPSLLQESLLASPMPPAGPQLSLLEVCA